MTDSSPPLISVIMPCYNAERHLPLSVGSVLAQSFSDWELIVVDDGSRDASWDLLQSLARKYPGIRAIRQSNSGPSVARNRGVAEARGEFIAFLDSDDTWHPQFMAKMLAALQIHPLAGLAYCGWQKLGLSGGRGQPFIPPEYEGPGKLEALLENCRWPIHGALSRTGVIRKAGGFDEGLSSCMDFDLWLKVGTAYEIIRVPEVLAYYHHHEGEQITKNSARIALNHLKVQENFIRCCPKSIKRLSGARKRRLLYGELMRRGFESYWKRDLPAARTIFRRVMRAGYGRPSDWLYTLPALLPLALHRGLIRWLENKRRGTSRHTPDHL